MIAYRADEKGRTIFDFSHNQGELGTYWTTSKKIALSYMNNAEGPELYTAEISLEKPKIVYAVNDCTDWNFDSKKLIEQGYDGVQFAGKNETIVYVFFNHSIEVKS